MPPPVSPTVRRRRLAAELRRLRERADYTGDEVARSLGWSAAKISRIETAKTGVKIVDVRRLLELYEVDGTYAGELLALAREAERKGWWEAYSDALPEKFATFVSMEAEAEAAWQWETLAIPGLFQTEEYARQTMLAMQSLDRIPPGQLATRVGARLRRQEVLTREKPLQFTVVLDESVLRRERGDQRTMHAQLMKLVELAELPNVALHILPLKGPHPVDAGSFTLLRFEPVYDITFHDVIYVEQLFSNFYFEEESDTYRYRLAFDWLHEAALDRAGSIECITRIAKSVWR
ncbi:helix-turn-helix domain-containing protein [Actinomadura scrupuli]|uniref:helix-turn-helix domain-containing protein n=1 Tax=Actinomadura scrupuli TaxID=559629 RepID=UPI003D95A8B0